MNDTALRTDLYELTMMQGYWRSGKMDVPSSFELTFRRIPEAAGYAIAAGIDDALDIIASTRFQKAHLEYLASLKLFEPGFLDYLEALQFTGDVWCVDEGTAVFPYEPLLQVQAPLLQGQWFETQLLNCINFQSLIATKASRIVHTASPASVVEFGLRRSHGPQGGLWASKVAYMSGCIGTSNVEAGYRYGIPLFGTHAHSWILSFQSELEAFRSYAETFPDGTTLLVDTYDTKEQGIPHAIKVAKELKATGHALFAIRLDSGDLCELAQFARAAFDQAGLPEVKIIASNDVDEYSIAVLKEKGAPIDSYGVGTRLATSYQDPAFPGVYKLNSLWHEGNWQPRMKLSMEPAKATLPGTKQVWRWEREGQIQADIMTFAEEPPPKQFSPLHEPEVLKSCEGGTLEPLLRKRMDKGTLTTPHPPLDQARCHVASQRERLPPCCHQLRGAKTLTVGLSPKLRDERQHLFETLAHHNDV